jgi:hypothetical protein
MVGTSELEPLTPKVSKIARASRKTRMRLSGVNLKLSG